MCKDEVACVVAASNGRQGTLEGWLIGVAEQVLLSLASLSGGCDGPGWRDESSWRGLPIASKEPRRFVWPAAL